MSSAYDFNEIDDLVTVTFSEIHHDGLTYILNTPLELLIEENSKVSDFNYSLYYAYYFIGEFEQTILGSSVEDCIDKMASDFNYLYQLFGTFPNNDEFSEAINALINNIEEG